MIYRYKPWTTVKGRKVHIANENDEEKKQSWNTSDRKDGLTQIL